MIGKNDGYRVEVVKGAGLHVNLKALCSLFHGPSRLVALLN